MRLPAALACLLLLGFVLVNVENDGFPLTHVERKTWFVGSARVRPDGTLEQSADRNVPAVWNARALAVNALVGAALALAVWAAASEVGRRLTEPPAG